MVLAAFANLVFKGGVVWVTGGTGLVRRVAPGFGVIMLMMAVALWLQ